MDIGQIGTIQALQYLQMNKNNIESKKENQDDNKILNKDSYISDNKINDTVENKELLKKRLEEIEENQEMMKDKIEYAEQKAKIISDRMKALMIIARVARGEEVSDEELEIAMEEAPTELMKAVEMAELSKQMKKASILSKKK